MSKERRARFNPDPVAEVRSIPSHPPRPQHCSPRRLATPLPAGGTNYDIPRGEVLETDHGQERRDVHANQIKRVLFWQEPRRSKQVKTKPMARGMSKPRGPTLTVKKKFRGISMFSMFAC